MSSVKQSCCEFWEKAHERGTDNEGYGSLVTYYNQSKQEDDEKARIGDTSALPPVLFCPWCGKGKRLY